MIKVVIREIFELFETVFLVVAVAIIAIIYLAVMIVSSPFWFPLFLIAGLARWAYSDESILQAYYLEGKGWLKAL